MTEEIFKILGIAVIAIFMVFLAIKSLKVHFKVMEGLTNNVKSGEKGEAGSAADYASNIKSNMIILQDKLLIPKYKKDYEDVLIHMDDHINHLMLQKILTINVSEDPDSMIKQFNDLNTLKDTKDTLNHSMKFLDGH